MTYSPNTARGTHTVETVMTVRDATSAPKDLDQKHSKAPCATRVSQSVSKHQATSSSMTTKLISAFGWRTTASLARWVGQTMTFLSSSSSPST
jgi:hypothetical protein